MHGTARRVNEVPDVYHFSTFIYMDEWDMNEESGAISPPEKGVMGGAFPRKIRKYQTLKNRIQTRKC